MEKIFSRATQGATLGGIIGSAIGTITAASLISLSAPLICVASLAAAVGGVSSSAIGTLIGSGVGMATGVAETIYDKKNTTD